MANPAATSMSRSSHSPMSFDSPYGDSGAFGVSSTTTSTSGVPYTAALDENTALVTPFSAIARSRVAVPVTFCS